MPINTKSCFLLHWWPRRMRDGLCPQAAYTLGSQLQESVIVAILLLVAKAEFFKCWHHLKSFLAKYVGVISTGKPNRKKRPVEEFHHPISQGCQVPDWGNRTHGESQRPRRSSEVQTWIWIQLCLSPGLWTWAILMASLSSHHLNPHVRSLGGLNEIVWESSQHNQAH